MDCVVYEEEPRGIVWRGKCGLGARLGWRCLLVLPLKQVASIIGIGMLCYAGITSMSSYAFIPRTEADHFPLPSAFCTLPPIDPSVVNCLPMTGTSISPARYTTSSMILTTVLSEWSTNCLSSAASNTVGREGLANASLGIKHARLGHSARACCICGAGVCGVSVCCSYRLSTEETRAAYVTVLSEGIA